MKEKIYQLALTAPLGKKFEIIELTETKELCFELYLESLEGITIDDCVKVSKHIMNNISEEENIELTVSSAGIDKPLRAPIQFIKNIGKKVEVKTNEGKKITGTLSEYSPEQIKLTTTQKKETQTINIPFQNIKQVRIKIF